MMAEVQIKECELGLLEAEVRSMDVCKVAERSWAMKFIQLILCVLIGSMMVFSVDVRSEHLATGRRLLRGDTVVNTSVPFVPASVPVFFINLESSVDRRVFLEAELEKRDMKFKRIRAVTSNEALNVKIEVQTIIPPNNHEVACISSHLVAMWEAVNDKTVDPENPYAIIMEDDVALQFDVDFSELIRNAPADFGVLQLTTSNSYQVKKMWDEYKAAASFSGLELLGESIWRRHALSDGLWSTQAYIIRKDAVREFVEKAVTFDVNQFRTIRLKPANKGACFRPPGMSSSFPCLQQFRMVADMYLYAALTPVYTIRVPIFNGASVGSVSTIPTKKDKDSAAAITFMEIGDVIQNVKEFSNLLPSYIGIRKPAAVIAERHDEAVRDAAVGKSAQDSSYGTSENSGSDDNDSVSTESLATMTAALPAAKTVQPKRIPTWVRPKAPKAADQSRRAFTRMATQS